MSADAARRTWRPIVTDPTERVQLAAAARALVRNGSATAADELAELALARAYVDPDDDGATLARAVTALAAGDLPPRLHGGAAGIGWIVAHLADGDAAEDVCGAIDRRVERALGFPEYDLISGVVGYGVYALERGARSLAANVLAELDRRVDSCGAWFTPPELVPANQRALAPNGYWNAGVAHGTPGVIALLARFVHADLPARALLERAVGWLLARERPLRSWYGAPSEVVPLAWCYGALGVAVALVAAARACDRADWLAHAVELARSCAGCDDALAEATFCHGTAGAAHLLQRMYAASGDPTLAVAARAWLDRTLAIHDRGDGDVSLLTGAAGVALVVHAAISEDEPEWDRLVLAGP